jgi:hypothetical protein
LADAPFRWSTFLLTLAAVSVGLAVWWRVLPPTYFTNDDVLLRLMVEGHAVPGQQPTGFLINAHSALGWALVHLRAHAPVIFTWDWALTVALILAITIILTIAVRVTSGSRMLRGAAILTIMAATVPVLSGLQFTISGMSAGAAAIALACRAFTDSTRPRPTVVALSAVLLIFGSLVRPIAAAAGAVAACYVFLVTTWATGHLTKQRLEGCCAVGIAAAAIYGVSWSANAVLYRTSPDWYGAYNHHWKIGVLFDWSGGMSDEDIEAMEAAADWTPNDFQLLRGWWGVDPALHGADRVGRAYDTFRQRRGNSRWPFFGLFLRPFNGAAYRDALKQSALPFAAVAAFMSANWPRRRTRAIIAAIGGAALLYLALQLAFKDLPVYVVGSLNVCVAAAVIAAYRHAEGASTPAWIRAAATGVLVVVTVVQIRTTALAASAENRQVKEVQNQVADLNALQPSLLVAHADAFPLEYWWRPFHVPSVQLPLLALSFDNQSPVVQRFLSATGRQPLLRAMCLDPSILVVSEERRLDPVTTYWREHLGAEVRWSQVFEGTFRVWRCDRVEPVRIENGGVN